MKQYSRIIVKLIMNQSEKEVGKFRDRNEISSSFQNRITELVRKVKYLKNKRRTRFSIGKRHLCLWREDCLKEKYNP